MNEPRRRGRPPSVTLLPGQRFGTLVTVSPAKLGGRWLVSCDCGRELTLFVSTLIGAGSNPPRRLCGVRCPMQQHALRVHQPLIPRGLTACGVRWNSTTRASEDRSKVNCPTCLAGKALPMLRWAKWAVGSLRDRQRRSGVACDLSAQQLLDIRTGKPCHYCSAALPPLIIGLDRKDNDRGYHLDNVVPCCPLCNDAKGHLLSYDEYVAAMRVRIEATGPGNAWEGRRWRTTLKVATRRNHKGG